MKTSMKKFLSLLLAFSMVLSLMSVSVFADEITALSAENVSDVNAGDTVLALAEGYTLEEANTALAARNLTLAENEGEPTTYTVTAGEPEPEGPTEYTITFNAAGGAGEMDAVTVEANSTYVVPECEFTSPEDMYAFAYWKNADGTIIHVGDTIEVTSDLTLTARWLPDIWTDHITTDDPADYGVVVDNEAMTVTVYDALGLAWVAKMTNTNNETWNWFADYTVQLGANIDLAGKYWEPIGNYSTYDGKFDGQGYTVSNLVQNVYSQDNDYAYLYDGKWSVYNPFGLFGYFYGSSLKNLTVDNFYVFSEGGLIGAVVGYAHPIGDTTFENITVKNCRLNGYNNSCAGVVGYAWCASSVNCKIYFKNIDVQDSNVFNTNYAAPGTMMSGVLGRFGSNGRLFVDFSDITVSAQLLPLNDAQSAYQWFRFRNAGMLVGDIDDTGKTAYNPFDYISISGPINVHYGEWSLQRYCEFREAGKPSYSGEGDWRYFRLDEDDNGNHGATYTRLGSTVTIADAFSHVHYDDENHDTLLVFDQLIGGHSEGGVPMWLLESEYIDVTYDVVFHTNGGTINSEYVTSLKPHESAELPTDVTRDGYFFGGWYEHEELTGDPVTSVNSNSQGTVKVFYAKWMRGVEWQNEDGTRLALDQYNDGDTPVYAGATPTKAEDDSYTYVFSGWSPAITKVNGGATYTAQFIAVAKTAEANGETVDNGDGSKTKVETVDGGTTTTVTNTASNEDVAENGDTTTSETTVTTTVTKDNVGTVTNVATTTETVVTTEETVSESVFTVTTETTTTTTATGEDTTTESETATTTVTLTENSVAATVDEEVASAVSGTTMTTNTITAGQVNVSAIAKDVLTENANDIPENKDVNVTVALKLKAELTAYDAEKETITFTAAPYMVTTISVTGQDDVVKEEEKVDNSYLAGEVTVKLPVPSGYAGKAGDTIYVKHSSEGYADDYFAVEVKSEGGKLYVEFEVEHFSTFELMVDGVYAIVFDANGGEGGKTVYIPENGAITAPAVTRSGYIFAGWSPAVPATAAETATYTAQWSAIVYDDDDPAPTTTITDEETPLSAFPIFYVDVAENAWYHDAIAYVTALDLMNGVGDDRFDPNANTTRGMVAVVMMRLAQGVAIDSESFFDVANDAYYAEAAAWAVENGVYVGFDDGSFRGELNILREQFAAVLYRYATAKGYDVSGKAELGSFTDSASVSGYAADAMAWAVDSGIIEGVGDNLLDPLGNATRAQLATMLMRFHALYTAEV